VQVTVVEKHPFDGPLVVLVDGQTRTIGERVARQVYVTRRIPPEAERTLGRGPSGPPPQAAGAESDCDEGRRVNGARAAEGRTADARSADSQ
jgi:hypothetical protein